MKLVIFTLVLDGMPWITEHWPEYRKLGLDWTWHVVEGVAAAENCTSWCNELAPRLSNDGTTEYLDAVAAHDKRVVLHRKELWHGKVEMCNQVMRLLYEPCVLLEADADELWTAEQIEKVVEMFEKRPVKNCAYFYCDYRVGPKVLVTSTGTYGNNTSYEWKRAWRIEPGVTFETHEPPKLSDFEEKAVMHATTKDLGLVFRHEAYTTAAQVEFKAKFYAGDKNPKGKLYLNALEGWHRLQDNKKWPAKLVNFFPWVDDNCIVDRIN